MVARRDYNTRGSWTAGRLHTWLNGCYNGQRIIVLANREPFSHDRAADGGLVVKRSASGLVTALEPIVRACSGVWVAHASGTADKATVERRDGLDVPPVNPKYRLRRVWLDDREHRGYYYGYANEGLWPLCHRTSVQPIFRPDDYKVYRAVNERFADAVCEEAEGDSPVVLVQDYHFALAPRIIRRQLPQSTIVSFWHIPWPHPRRLKLCPSARQLVAGLLGSSIIGFQTPLDCSNFIEAVDWYLEAAIDREQNAVTRDGRATTVRAYPVSIEWPSRWVRALPRPVRCRQEVCEQLGVPPEVRLGVGVDRLDYTKGIEEKFLAVERLLDTRPEFRERFTFVQLAEPSRDCLPAYRDLRVRILQTADRINQRFGNATYRPLIMLEAHHEPADVHRFLRAADLCHVGSLHDGMNLVAKEFVAVRDDHRGVLVLSCFAGAARELSGAIIVDPYAIDGTANALADALTMSSEEQSNRMRHMRAVVAEFNTYRWAGQMLQDAACLRGAPAAITTRQFASDQQMPA